MRFSNQNYVLSAQWGQLRCEGLSRSRKGPERFTKNRVAYSQSFKYMTTSLTGKVGRGGAFSAVEKFSSAGVTTPKIPDELCPFSVHYRTGTFVTHYWTILFFMWQLATLNKDHQRWNLVHRGQPCFTKVYRTIYHYIKMDLILIYF